jgi:hypothetical protein
VTSLFRVVRAGLANSEYGVSALKAIDALEAAADVHREAFISTLAHHALVEIRCDHESQTDTPVCNCAVVALGSHPSVQAAKEAWAAHVWEALNA